MILGDVKMDNEKRTCFIITPIGEEKDPIRRHIEGIIDGVIVPVMESDYYIQVAHRLFQTGSITKQIIELIYQSDLVIVNLTQSNPNVMYELAFRHTLGKPTITMAEIGTKLPFDISSERTIFYKNDIRGAKEAQEELKKYLSHIDYDSGQTTGPIHDYLDSVELNNLIYSHNQNKNTTEILDLIAKRLESIENSIPTIKEEILWELDNSPTTNIKPNLDFEVFDFKNMFSLESINKSLDEIRSELMLLNSHIQNTESLTLKREKKLYEQDLFRCILLIERCINDINYMIYYKNKK